MQSRNSRWIRIAVMAVLCISAVGFAAAGSFFDQSRYAEVQGIDLTKTAYRDGTYTGTATGFRPNLTVEVKVEKGKVVQVRVVAHSEVGDRFFSTPIRVVPGQIVKKQSTAVDAVSGATATSYGIMAAVEDALKKAAP